MSGKDLNGNTSLLYLCIRQFNSRLGDELNLKVGDKIQVLADDSEYNDGWYMGKNLTTGKVGLYPKSFTQVLVEDTNDDVNLLRSRSRSRSRRIASGGSNISNPESPVAKIKNSFENMSINNGKSPKSGLNGLQRFNDFNGTNDNNDTFNSTSSQPLDDIEDEDSHDYGVNKTMNDIDKALEELQSDSYIHRSNTTNHKRTTSNISLTEDLNPKDAMSWTPKQVTSYFALGLGFDTDVAGKFARHKITGAILFELDLAHLKELDIDSFGTRFQIHKAIEDLKKIVDGHKEADAVEKPQLLQSANLTREPNNAFGHLRTKSQSYDDLPETNKLVSPKMDKTYKFGGEKNDPYYNRNASTSVLHPPPSQNHMSSPGRGTSRPVSSIYEQSVHSRNHSRNISNTSDYQHRRNSSVITAGHHKRNSSMFSFLSKEKEDVDNKRFRETHDSPRRQEKLISPVKLKKGIPEGSVTPVTPREPVDIDNTEFSPKKLKSISYKYDDPRKLVPKDEKRSVSDSVGMSTSTDSTPKAGSVSRFKTLRTASTTNFKNLTTSKKLKTSAFQEGIRNITPDEAIKTANYSGFMSKKSGNNLSWRSRYFTLHGTRLSYFTSLKDKKEKGLIDITAHKVIPITSEGEDKYVALYAASTGLGRYCFKLIPPAPGFKKGLTFTQPKTHFFAVETQEEMRGWMKALMTATIDIDDSVPVVSSCSTPTVSLAKAQELLAKAREETKLKDEERAKNANGFFGEMNNLSTEDDFSEAQLTSFIGNYTLDPNTSGENSPLVESIEEYSNPAYSDSPHPKLSIDTSTRTSIKGPTTPQANQPAGFASPYLLASGLLSPKLNNNGNFSPTLNNDDTTSNNSMNQTINTSKISNLSNTTTPIEQKREYFPSESAESTPHLQLSNGRIKSLNSVNSNGKKKRQSEKLLAYSSDGSGNHTFYIKQKR